MKTIPHKLIMFAIMLATVQVSNGQQQHIIMNNK